MKIRREDTALLTFDLQNVITCPRAGVKDLFYYRKLTVYNLTGQVQTFKDRKFENKTHCIVWHECQAGRGGNEIASSVSKLLQDIVQNNPLVTKIITWSLVFLKTGILLRWVEMVAQLWKLWNCKIRFTSI